MEEKQLIDSAVSGDKDAFAALYMLYRDALFRYAFFRLGNETDAEDAVSACIVAAYENIRTLRAEKAFRTWIFRILYRCCCALIARQIEAKEREGEEALARLPAPDSGVSPELAEAFGILSDADREIVLLAVIAGYTSREIAAVIGSKPATVRSRLSRSLSKMRKFLEDTE